MKQWEKGGGLSIFFPFGFLSLFLSLRAVVLFARLFSLRGEAFLWLLLVVHVSSFSRDGTRVYKMYNVYAWGGANDD
jgi:hypothetical protein